ncbi:MAG: hypothetical protein A2V85_12300 [Chloroflexi bacterium RBG_16_72_14]|nr:MAG: hypothetical protein A2V85_12300 [Chloroflexi bacterium RBG_16_72_14]
MSADRPPERLTAQAIASERLFWRSEILQAMYWMDGEGIASAVSPPRLAEFLDTTPDAMVTLVGQLVRDGYLRPLDDDPGRFTMTEQGRREGARSFGDEFAELTRPAHSECGPGCWCRDPKYAGVACPSDQGAAHGH